MALRRCITPVMEVIRGRPRQRACRTQPQCFTKRVATTCTSPTRGIQSFVSLNRPRRDSPPKSTRFAEWSMATRTMHLRGHNQPVPWYSLTFTASLGILAVTFTSPIRISVPCLNCMGPERPYRNEFRLSLLAMAR